MEIISHGKTGNPCFNKENAEKFINFMQKPEIAAENCKYLRYGCANDEAVKLLDDEIKNNELTLPSDIAAPFCSLLAAR